MDLKLRTLMPLVVCLCLGCFQANPPSPETAAPGTVTRQPANNKVESSYDTPRDGRFAEFVQQTAGGMFQKIAVGIERHGTLRVQLSEEVSPEDTLPLTRSLLSGAQKDFPDKPITLSVFDPQGEPILKAHYRPEDGVRYEIAKSDRPGTSSKSADTTSKDQQFANWAMETAPQHLRYVEADLEKHGRLWFGITRAVAPEDVRELTSSLLKGARTEFPRRELTATVFDPDGAKIGRATLATDGSVRWSQ